MTEPLLYSMADPVTSAQAANTHKESGALAGNRRKALECVRRWPGCTAVELAHRAASVPELAIDRIELSRRLSDLRSLGHVRQGDARVCTVAGTRQVTWEPVRPL